MRYSREMQDLHIVDDFPFFFFLPFVLNKIEFPIGWNIRAKEKARSKTSLIHLLVVLKFSLTNGISYFNETPSTPS